MTNLKNEIKKVANFKTTYILVFIVCCSVLFLQNGVNHCKNQAAQCNEFLELENAKIDQSIASLRLGFRGLLIFRQLGEASFLFSIFNSSSNADTFQSTIDNSGILLDSGYRNGKSILAEQNGFSPDLSLFIFYVLTLVVSFFGYQAMQDYPYIKSIASVGGKKQIFIELFLSRFLFIFFTLLILFFIIYVQFMVNGIDLSSLYFRLLIVFFGVTLFFLSLFLLMGIFGGMIQKKYKGLIVSGFFWLLLIFILPWALNVLFIKPLKSDLNSSYRYENRRFVLVDDYQKYINDEIMRANALDRKETEKKVFNQYMDKVFNRISDINHEMVKEAETALTKIFFLKALIPSTFYSSLTGELSSLGNQASIDFVKASFERQKIIVDSYFKIMLNKDYEFDPGSPVIPCQSKLPGFFYLGFAVLILCNGFLIIIDYFKFKKMITPRAQKDFHKINLCIQEGRHTVLNIPNGYQDFLNKIFNTFFNGENFEGKIKIGNHPIDHFRSAYLPDLIHFKGLKQDQVPTYQDIVKYLPKLKKCNLLIIDNIDSSFAFPAGITILELRTNVVHRDNAEYNIVTLYEDTFDLKFKEHQSLGQSKG